MKLALKLVSAFMLCAALLAAGHAYFTIQRETIAFEKRAEADAQELAGSIQDQIPTALQQMGPEGLDRLLQNTSTYAVTTRVRWVWFDARPGTPHSPTVPPERLQAVVVERFVSIPAQRTDGNRELLTYCPIEMGDHRKGGLEVSRPMEELEEKKREVIRQTVQLMISMLLLTGGIAAVLGVRMVGRPLNLLIEKTQRIGAGDLSGPVHLRTGDELAQLGESLNEMCEALASSEDKIREETEARTAAVSQLRHADRLKTVGRLASGMAHELGTPLNVVSGRAGLIASGKLSDEEIVQSASAIQAEANKMTTIIRQLLDFARRNTPHRVKADLWQIVHDTAKLLTPIAQKQNVTVELPEHPDPATTMVDTAQIQQVLTNLIVNAIQAMPEGGALKITIEGETVVPPNEVEGTNDTFYRIDVEDEGEGIAEQDLDQLFEPFFTTKDVGQGTGLGLSIAYGIVQEHGGCISVTSEPGQGSCFSVYLPKEPQA